MVARAEQLSKRSNIGATVVLARHHTPKSPPVPICQPVIPRLPSAGRGDGKVRGCWRITRPRLLFEKLARIQMAEAAKCILHDPTQAAGFGILTKHASVEIVAAVCYNRHD